MKEYGNINNQADILLNRIKSVIRDELSDAVIVEGAIVQHINEDGTVDVYIPPERDKVFTRISNQSPFELQKGDSVELLLKNSSFNNCWIIAKHGVTHRNDKINVNISKSEIREIVVEVLKEYGIINNSHENNDIESL